MWRELRRVPSWTRDYEWQQQLITLSSQRVLHRHVKHGAPANHSLSVNTTRASSIFIYLFTWLIQRRTSSVDLENISFYFTPFPVRSSDCFVSVVSYQLTTKTSYHGNLYPKHLHLESTIHKEPRFCLCFVWKNLHSQILHLLFDLPISTQPVRKTLSLQINKT